MQIPKCKYCTASGERVLENVFRLGSTCSVSSGGIWASNRLHCSFLYTNVWKVTGHIGGRIGGHINGCFAGLLYLGCWLTEAVKTLEAVLVWVCSWCEILLLWVPPVLVLSGCSWSVWSTVVQEILPVLFQGLAIANPFKAKQESQGALESLDKPPCYILWCSELVLFSQ